MRMRNEVLRAVDDGHPRPILAISDRVFPIKLCDLAGKNSLTCVSDAVTLSGLDAPGPCPQAFHQSAPLFPVLGAAHVFMQVAGTISGELECRMWREYSFAP